MRRRRGGIDRPDPIRFREALRDPRFWESVGEGVLIVCIFIAVLVALTAIP